MSKKSIVLAAASIMTAATVAIGGTLAYFNQSKELKNTFSMGGSSGDDESFSILLDEAKVTLGTDANGTPTWEAQEVRTGKEDTGVDYGDMVYPGAELPKDPMVTNTGEYPLYARMIVTLPNAEIWAAALGTGEDAKKLADAVFTGTDPGFTREAAITDGSLVVTYTWNSIVKPAIGDEPAGTTGKAFKMVNIPANFTGDEKIVDNDGNAVITVRAEAIQSAIDGVDTAAEAFAKYPTTGA